METEIIFEANGTPVNGISNLLQLFKGFSNSGSIALFKKQVTLEFYNSVTQLPDGGYVVDNTSVVTTGLSGSLTIVAKPSINSPFIVELPASGVLDVGQEENVILCTFPDVAV